MDEQWLRDAIRNFETRSVEDAEMWGIGQGSTEHAIAFLQWNKRREREQISLRRAEDFALAERTVLTAEQSVIAAEKSAEAAIRSAVAAEGSAATALKTYRIAILALICSVAAIAIAALPLLSR